MNSWQFKQNNNCILFKNQLFIIIHAIHFECMQIMQLMINCIFVYSDVIIVLNSKLLHFAII